jgi:hypothetical protein
MREKGDIVKSGFLVVVIGVLAAQAVYAQTVPPPPAPAPVPVPIDPQMQTPPPAPAGSPAPGATTPAQPAAFQQAAPLPQQAIAGRRGAIKTMEVVLSRAVLGGAEQLAEQLGRGNPNMSFFTGQARARGIYLEGYGVLFQVEIPEMQTSLVMSVTTLERDMAVAETLNAMRRAISAVPDSVGKIEMEQAFKKLQIQVGPVQQLNEPQAPRGVVSTTASSDSAPVTDPTPSAAMPFPRDPTTVYREAIKAALIDAMLDYSRGMNIQPDEWLTVAAQRGDSPLAPNEIVNSTTLVLRIKGGDLAIYEADRSRKEEIRKRVEVKEF